MCVERKTGRVAVHFEGGRRTRGDRFAGQKYLYETGTITHNNQHTIKTGDEWAGNIDEPAKQHRPKLGDR